MRRPGPAAVVGAGAVSAFGVAWRGLGRAILEGGLSPGTSTSLPALAPGTRVSEVAALPPGSSVEAKARKLMSRSAVLASVALREALGDAGWEERLEEVGCFAGIGAGGGPVEDLKTILEASVVDGALDPVRFVREGLGSTNPLFAFHLLNNYVLCHGAILCGLGGPNAAFHSRGSGTLTALSEALWALEDGDCTRTLAGGADSALHPSSWLELLMDGRAAEGFVPGEGAAFLALARDAERPLATVEACCVREGGPAAGAELLTLLLSELPHGGVDLVLLVGGSAAARERLLPVLGGRYPEAAKLDLSASLGDALAAAPGLGWVAALDLLLAGEAKRALVVNAGVDGSLGAVLLSRGGPR